MCDYKFREGEECKEEALPGFNYCILHVDLPEDEKSVEFKRINKLKEVKVKEKVNNGDFYFQGAKLTDINFDGIKIGGDVNFTDATIKEHALFRGATIEGDAWFEGATIGIFAWFEGATIKGNALFEGAIIKGHALFKRAIIGNALFGRAIIEGGAWFGRATIGGIVNFSYSKISYLTFEGAKFNNMSGQEMACRAARRTQEEAGNRMLADYHFYREMEARRKQKYKIVKGRRIPLGFLELPIQYIFGYGVYPWRVIATWLLAVFTLANEWHKIRYGTTPI